VRRSGRRSRHAQAPRRGDAGGDATPGRESLIGTGGGLEDGSPGGKEGCHGMASRASELGLLPDLARVGQFVDASAFKAKAQALARLENGFRDEYMCVRRQAEGAEGYADRITESTAQVRACNRYSDIVCLEDTRVHLETQVEHDYINASWIRVEGLKSIQYIAAQAPLPKTFESFWRMVWEYDVPLVLMLTPWQEHAHGRTRIKADPYFPQEPGTSETHGDFKITCEDLDLTNHAQGLDVRRLQLKNNHRDAARAPIRTVYHVHFTHWPDFGSVRDLGSYLNMHATVRRWEETARGATASTAGAASDSQDPHEESTTSTLKQSAAPTAQFKAPTVNHCSAGIGRTGTFIAIDAVLRWITDRVNEASDSPAKLNLADIVKQLRNQRPGMVVTLDQYVMLYQVIYYALFGSSLSDAADDTSESFEGMDDAEIYRSKLGKRPL